MFRRSLFRPFRPSERQRHPPRPRVAVAVAWVSAWALVYAISLSVALSEAAVSVSAQDVMPTPALPLSYPLNCTQFDRVRTSLRSYVATSAASESVHSIVFEVSLVDESGDGLALPGDANANYANFTKWTWSKDPAYDRARLSMRWHAGLLSLNTLTFHSVSVQLPLVPVNAACWTSPYAVTNFTRAEQLSAIGMAISALLPASDTTSSVLNDFSAPAPLDFESEDGTSAGVPTATTALGGLGTRSLCHRSLLLKGATLGEDSDSAAISGARYFDTVPGAVDALQSRDVRVQYTCCTGTQDGLAAAAYTLATGNASTPTALALVCNDLVEPNNTLRIARELILVATVLAVMFMPLLIKPIVDYCNCGCFRKHKRRKLNQKDTDDAPAAAAPAPAPAPADTKALAVPPTEEATIQILPPEPSADVKGEESHSRLLHRRPSVSLKAQAAASAGSASAVEMAATRSMLPPVQTGSSGASAGTSAGAGKESKANTPQQPKRRLSLNALDLAAGKEAAAAAAASPGAPQSAGAESTNMAQSALALASAARSAAARDRARRRRGKLPASESVTWDSTLPHHPLCFPSAIEAETIAAADGDFVCDEAEQAYERLFARSAATGVAMEHDDAFCCCCRTSVCCWCFTGSTRGADPLLGGSAYDGRSGSFRMNNTGRYSSACNHYCCCCCKSCCDEETCSEKCRGSLRRELCISLIVVILPALLVFRYFMYIFFESEELEYRMRWDREDVPLFLDLDEFLILMFVYAPFGLLLVLVDMAKTLNWKSEYLIAQRRAEWANKRAKLKLAILPPPDGADPNAEPILIRPPTPPGQVGGQSSIPGTRRSYVSRRSHDFGMGMGVGLASVGSGGIGSGASHVGQPGTNAVAAVAAAAAAAAAAGASASGVAAAAAAAAAAHNDAATGADSAGGPGSLASSVGGAGSDAGSAGGAGGSVGGAASGGHDGAGFVRPSVVVPSARGSGFGATANTALPDVKRSPATDQPVIQVVTVQSPPPAAAPPGVAAPTPASLSSSASTSSLSSVSVSASASASTAGAHAEGLNPHVPVAAVSGTVTSPPQSLSSGQGLESGGPRSPNHIVGGPLQAIPEIVTQPAELAAAAVSAPVAAVSGSAVPSHVVSPGSQSGSPVHTFVTPAAAGVADPQPHQQGADALTLALNTAAAAQHPHHAGGATAIVTNASSLPPNSVDTLSRAVAAVNAPPHLTTHVSGMDNLELAAEAAAQQQRMAAAAGSGSTTTATRVNTDSSESHTPHGTTTTRTHTQVSTITVNVQPPRGADAARDSSMLYGTGDEKTMLIMDAPAVNIPAGGVGNSGSGSGPGVVVEPLSSSTDVNGFFSSGGSAQAPAPSTAAPVGSAAAAVDLYAAENPMGFATSAPVSTSYNPYNPHADEDAHAGYFYSGGLYGPRNGNPSAPDAPEAPPPPTFADYVGVGVFKEMGSAVMDQVKLHAYHYREIAGETKRTRGAAIDPVTALHEDMMVSLWCMFTLRGWMPLLTSLRQQWQQLYCCRCRCRSESCCGRLCGSSASAHDRSASADAGNGNGNGNGDPNGDGGESGLPQQPFSRLRRQDEGACCCVGCCSDDGFDQHDVAALEGVGTVAPDSQSGDDGPAPAPISPRSKYLMRRSARRRGCCFLFVRFMVTLIFGPTLIVLNSVPLGHLMVMLIPLLFQSQSSADPDGAAGDVVDPVTNAAVKAADEETDSGNGWRHIVRYVVALGWLLLIIFMWIILTQALMEVLLYFCIGVAVNASDLVPTVVFAVTLFLTAVDTMRVLQAPFWELKLIFLQELLALRPININTPLPLSTLCPPTRVPNSILTAIMARELNPSHKRTMAGLKFLLSSLFLSVVFLAVVSYRGGPTQALTPVGQSGILAFSGLVTLSSRLLGYTTTFRAEERVRLVAVCKRRLLHYFAGVEAANAAAAAGK